MTPFEELRRAARERRDLAIEVAKREYTQTIRELNTLARRLGHPRRIKARRNPRNGHSGDLAEMNAREAAETVLRERGEPMTLTELTVAIMERGCRACDDPGEVKHAIRSAFGYHRHRFKKTRDKRWVLLPSA